MSERKSSWLIKPKSFIKLLGADYELMRKAGGTVLFKFYVSSFVICLIALVSFFSVRYAIELLFHVTVVEVFLSLFLSLLFLLMYVFLINTFTKDVQHRSVFNVSNIVRISFVVFMGFILSKPLEIYVFKDKLNKDVTIYKQRLNEEHNQKISNLFGKDISSLEEQMKRYTVLNKDNSFALEIQRINNKIDSINQKKQNLIDASGEKIGKGDYFIYRIKRAAYAYPLSWVLCLGIILLFVLPGFIVYSISKEEVYFKMKKDLETRIIRIAYSNFTKKYSSLFKDKYKLDVEFYSKYEDPPFNKELIKEKSYQSSKEFHTKYGIG
jgi:hypothetical protein